MTTGTHGEERRMATGTDGTRYDRWLLRTMNDARTKRFHASRGARHRIVAAHVGTTALGLTGMVGCFASAALWPVASLLVALLVWVPLTGLLNSMTRGLLELRVRFLDERQVAERGTAHLWAYRINSWLLTAALLGFYVLWVAGTSMADLAGPLAATGLVAYAVHRLLPLWIAALRVRDEPQDDEEEWPAPVSA
ncbi:hypothetical protein [Streptomyces qinglanensis]|uniref:Uncharacterized protein n=1 Tax=Streptomyces qinglanensis TaxID=943816 RepID=A0A1H9VCJ1_9ACTN|nr:hypothetical protein [Streptomyces qinglanensis]SES19308.1 hypothetical protein SAMN05421870_111161 [Streptomyces qinglanensis]